MREASAHHDETVEELLGQVADEFTDRLRRGERPDIEDYARANPRIAAVIREVFPSLLMMPPGLPDSPASDEAARSDTSFSGTLGDYRLIREIGRGGMGIVYEAEQISLGRRVALKVLSFAAVLDPRQLQRFKNEAQAAAQLHHTHIVPVFSVGCERGVHYYAMQYIDGQPLSAVIPELRHLAGLPPTDDRPPTAQVSAVTSSLAAGHWAPRLSNAAGSSAEPLLPAGAPARPPGVTLATGASAQGRAFHESIANLGIQAAEALQHAHERGVVHRDIKPSNLLLDAGGHLWVTDFGLAMMQTDTGLTLTGDLLGTVRYMSPEQALAKRIPVDHRTDIYSLGVTLYELLALEPAFNGRDRQELLRQIALEETRPLRRVRRSVPQELETIVSKAMAKNPEDRYATAHELAEDLRRYLEDRPILAKPPSMVDLAAKWARRHRSAVAAAAILLVLSVAGLSVSTVLIARERAKALRQRDVAQANLQVASEVVDRMLTHVAAAELADVPSTEGLRRALLEDATRFQAGLLAEKSPEPTVRRDAGLAYLRLAQMNTQVGQDAAADQAYREAIRIMASLCRDFPKVAEYGVRLADADLALGTMLWERRRYPEAETLARDAHAVMARIVADSPDSRPFRRELARSLDLLGLVLRDTARAQDAEATLRESLKLRAGLVDAAGDSIDGAECRIELTRTKRNLADVLMKTGRRDEAEQVVREVLSIQEDLVDWFPDNPAYATELSHTRRWWDEVLRLDRRQGGTGARADSARPESEQASGYSKIVADTYRALGDALKRTGDVEGANAAYLRSVGIVEKLVGQYPDNPKYREDLAQLHRVQANGLNMRWHVEEAEKTLLLAIEIQQRLVTDFPDRAGYARQLADDRKQLEDLRARKPVGAMLLLSKTSTDGVARAVELASAMDDITIPDDSLLLTIVAEHLALGGGYERAETLLRRSIALEADNAARYKTLGWILLGQGRGEEARDAFKQVHTLTGVTTDEQAVGACPDPCTAGYFLDMVSQEQFVHRWQGILLLGSRLDPWPWFFIGLRMELDGRLDEAKEAYRKCEELESLPNAHHTAHWGAYRLRKLNEHEKVAANKH
jgi:eukaryotic-like serine/threonine-protein kinase